MNRNFRNELPENFCSIQFRKFGPTLSPNSFRAHNFQNGRSRNSARVWSCSTLAVRSEGKKTDIMKKTHHQHIPKTLENAGEFRMFIYELTESKIFSVSILFVILLNTVILVIQTDEGFSVKAGNSALVYFNMFFSYSFLLFCRTCIRKTVLACHAKER